MWNVQVRLSEGDVDHTAISETQTGFDCWCRILSFKVSYQMSELGCRSIQAGGKIRNTTIRIKPAPLCVTCSMLHSCYLRKGGCTVSSAWRPVNKGVWSFYWSWGCIFASSSWRLSGCEGPRTAPLDGTGCSSASPLQWEWCPAEGACPK